MRKTFIGGNWKMNLTKQEAYNFIDELQKRLPDGIITEICLFPSFLFIESIIKMIDCRKIFVGAQNLHFEESGAYTGEISAPMLSSIGCTHVIIGHSERREFFNETDLDINRKLLVALRHDLIPVLCVGETLDQKETGRTEEILNRQIIYALMGVDNEYLSRLIIAYEPVWAIGTGLSARENEVEMICKFIRNVVSSFAGNEISSKIRIIYGGSVTPKNAREFMKSEDVDGLLVGGASLDPKTFFDIIMISNSLSKNSFRGG